MKRAVLLVVIVILIPLSALFIRYQWHALDYYIPENNIPLSGSFRSMIEHDEFMQDKEWPYVLNLDDGESVYGSWHTNELNWAIGVPCQQKPFIPVPHQIACK